MKFTLHRLACVTSIATLASVSAAAQTADQAMKSMATSADIAAMIAKAKSERKADQPTFTQPILRFAPYTASLEYRAAVGPAAIHNTEAEMFYVIDGSGTLMLGGKLVNGKQSNPDNLTGTAIEGGTSRKVSKGDFFVVPEKTPHWFSTIDGTLVLMSLHLPRPLPAAH